MRQSLAQIGCGPGAIRALRLANIYLWAVVPVKARTGRDGHGEPPSVSKLCCSTLLWATFEGHSCGKLVEHSQSLWDTLVGILPTSLVRNSCGILSRNTLVGATD